MMKNILTTAIVLLITIQHANAQDFFENISKNEWQGTGFLLSKPASFNMKWESTLGTKFYQLTFQNQQTDTTNAPIFRAMAMYKLHSDQTITGTWFDSRGVTFPVKGSYTEKQLIVYWGDSDTEQGKTVYDIHTNDTVSVTDYFLNGADFFEFGRATYTARSDTK